jgi:hypothetical protein
MRSISRAMTASVRSGWHHCSAAKKRVLIDPFFSIIGQMFGV